VKLINKIWEENERLAREEMQLYKTLKIDKVSLNILINEYNELFKTNKCTKGILQRYFGTKVYIAKNIDGGYMLER